jgi:hypothetical protein
VKLKQLTAGIATGYVVTGVQFLAAMVLVPFLLRRDILGVEGYGRAFTLIAFMGAGAVITVGVRLSFERSISKAVGSDPDGTQRQVGSLIGSGTILLFALCAVIGLPALIWETALLDLVRLPLESDYRVAFRLAVVWMTVENALFLLRSPLMARGAISYINCVMMGEVLLRTAVLFLLLPSTEAVFISYFAVHLAARILHFAGFIGWSLTHAPADFRGLTRVSVQGIKETVLYSRSITLAEGASFLVRRGPLLLASRYLAPAEVGFVALVVNTIQNYVLTVLFAVVRPLALPIAARFDPRRLTATARKFFFDLEGLYCAGVFLVVAEAIVLAPDLIRLWLGEGYGAIVLPAQVILGGCAVEITYAIRRSLLIGQGLLPEAVSRILALAMVTICVVWIGITVGDRWELAVFATAGYLVLTNLFGIGSVWSKHFVRPSEPVPGFLRFASFAPIFVVALVASRFVSEGSMSQDVLAAVAVFACSILSIQLFVLPLQKIHPTIIRLTRSMDRDLFDS